LRRLEKYLGIYDDEKNPKYPERDPEYDLKAYMTSWEGIKPDFSFNQQQNFKYHEQTIDEHGSHLNPLQILPINSLKNKI
jgi:hypothetical protein